MIKEKFVKPTLTNASHYVLVCGPPGLNETSKGILTSLGYHYVTYLGMPNKYPEKPTNWIGKLHRKNPHVLYLFVSFFIMWVIWLYSGGKFGMNGRFCVEGYINEDKVMRYAFRLVKDPVWSKGVEPPDEGCLMDI
jgi:hypothetical protein